MEDNKEKIPLTREEKKHLAIYKALPKDSKIKEMIKNGTLTNSDIDIVIPAIIIGAGFDRKQVATLFSLTLGLQSHIREVRKISREQIKRARTRYGMSPIQRRYFENRIIYGYSSKRKTIAEASEVARMLISCSENQNSRLEYLAAGVDQAKLARKIIENKEKYEEICQSVIIELQEKNELHVLDLFRNLYWEAQKGIKSVEDLIKQILKGIKRPYLASSKRKVNDKDL